MAKLKTSKAEAEKITLQTWLINNYVNIASNLFKYEGLEDFGEELTSEIVERIFIYNGCANVFKDDMLGLLWLPVAPSTELNVYGVPQKYQTIGLNGKTWLTNVNNSVLARNNGSYSPDLPMITYYCERIADCEMAMKVNINTNKMPFSLSGDPDQLLTMKNTIEKITGNELALYQPKKIKNSAVEPLECKVLNTGAEYIADKLNDTRLDYISSLLTYLGLDNISVEKRERLNMAEAGANDEHVKSNLYLKLKCRKEACEKINKMFGTSLNVNINYDFIENFKYAEEAINNTNKEGDEDVL